MQEKDFPEDFLPKDKKRAIRRQLKEKTKARAKKIAHAHQWNEEKTVKIAEHLKNCSCYICTESRKLNGEPFSDKKRRPIED